MPGGVSTMRFSTWPSAETRTTKARPGLKGTNSMCFAPGRRLWARGPGRRRRRGRRASSWPAPGFPAGERPDCTRALLMVLRSSSESSPNCSRPSTNRRRPRSVGRRPAEVWGENSRPASVRSAMTLRMVAGERLSGRQAGEGAAAHRLAGFDILLDDFAQHGGRAHVQPRRQAGRLAGWEGFVAMVHADNLG